MMSFTAFSQVLTPKIFVEGKDTLFGFTIPQSKLIANTIVLKQYCDSITIINNNIITGQDSIIKMQRHQATILRSVIENDKGQMVNLNILNETLKLDLAKSQGEAIRLKRRRWIYFGAGVLSSTTITLIHIANKYRRHLS